MLSAYGIIISVRMKPSDSHNRGLQEYRLKKLLDRFADSQEKGVRLAFGIYSNS